MRPVDKISAEQKIAYMDTLATFELRDRVLTEVRPPSRFVVPTLTKREEEVAKLLAEGLSNKLVAARLGISAHTAKFHTDNLIRKFNVGNRAGVAAEAVRRGLA